MKKLILSFILFTVTLIAAEEEQEGRLLNNKNTATLSAAAVGLGIGVVGSLLVSKAIEDRGCKDDPLGFIPDILGKKRCRKTNQNYRYNNQQSNYNIPAVNNYPTSNVQPPKFSIPSNNNQNYPSPGYFIPTTNEQYTPTIDYSIGDQYSSGSHNVIRPRYPTPFTQTLGYKPKPNDFHTPHDAVIISSEKYQPPNQIHELGHHPSSGEFYPQDMNPAIQPRNLPTLEPTNLFTPVHEEKEEVLESKPHTFSSGLLREGRKLESQTFRQTPTHIAT